ncbi:MAG: DmsE family decaheme c-type cytochrome [Acidobacteria bacterium]|nr:DmsE family decaheme c-type cytochrome [Acidobacteriota bacterium]
MLLTRSTTRAGLVIVGLVAIISVSGTAGARAATPEAGAVQAPATQETPEQGYVGQAKCLTCHEKREYKATLHGRKADERTPAATHGCETCHGPGQGHVTGGPEGGLDRTKIVNPNTLKPQEASEICLKCHMRGTHTLFTGNQHDQRNVGCVTCHSVHNPKGEKQIKATTQPEMCGGCHRNIVNKLYRFNHMPVREGKVVCSSCHNPHGSANVKLLKAGTTIDEACTSCHSEKRGPYLWEHAPVANACVTCHDPHGSNNERLLVAKVPFLCQRCHVTSRHPPTVYDGFALKNSTSANRLIGQGCVVCHVQIHGSNAPSGKYFHR